MLPAPVHPLSPDAHAHSSAAAARESSASYLTASDLGAALSSGEAAVASTSTSSSAAVAAATTADDKATGAAAKTAGGAAETRRRGQLERILAGRDPRSSLSTTASRTTAPSEPRRLRKTQPPPSSSSRSSSAHRKPLPHGATTISHSNSSSKDDATTTIVLPRTPAEMTLDELEPVAKAWDARLVAALVRSLSRELSYATTRSARDEGQTTTAAAASTRRRRDRRRVGQGGESPTETGHDSDERRGPKGKRVVYDQGASREDWLPSRSRRRGQQAGKRKRVPWRGWDDELPVGASSGDRRDAVEEEEDESAGAASDSAHSSDDSHAERLRRPAHRHPPRRPERHASAVQHDEETGEWRITLHLGEDEEVEGEGSRVRGEDGSSELADAQETREPDLAELHDAINTHDAFSPPSLGPASGDVVAQSPETLPIDSLPDTASASVKSVDAALSAEILQQQQRRGTITMGELSSATAVPVQPRRRRHASLSSRIFSVFGSPPNSAAAAAAEDPSASGATLMPPTASSSVPRASSTRERSGSVKSTSSSIASDSSSLMPPQHGSSSYADWLSWRAWSSRPPRRHANEIVDEEDDEDDSSALSREQSESLTPVAHAAPSTSTTTTTTTVESASAGKAPAIVRDQAPLVAVSRPELAELEDADDDDVTPRPSHFRAISLASEGDDFEDAAPTPSLARSETFSASHIRVLMQQLLRNVRSGAQAAPAEERPASAAESSLSSALRRSPSSRRESLAPNLTVPKLAAGLASAPYSLFAQPALSTPLPQVSLSSAGASTSASSVAASVTAPAEAPATRTKARTGGGATMELDMIAAEDETPPTMTSNAAASGAVEEPLVDRFGFVYDVRSSMRLLREARERSSSHSAAAKVHAEADEACDDIEAELEDLREALGLPPTLAASDAGSPAISPSPSSAALNARPTLARRRSSRARTQPGQQQSMRRLLAQLTDAHERADRARQLLWDDFVRRRQAKLAKNAASTPESTKDVPLEDEQSEEVSWHEHLIGVAEMGGKAGKDDWREFKELVQKGIPITYRPKIWAECSGATDIREPGLYQELLTRHANETNACLTQIEMDCHRTFPTNVFFAGNGKGVDKLRNVLTAYSWRNPEIGYCQGMNNLTATLLLTYPAEEDAFWVLCCIVERILPSDYYTSQLLVSQADQRVLRDLVEEHAPKVAAHLDDLGVELPAVTFGWFLSLFTDSLPIQTLFRVWDLLFVFGTVVLFRVAMAVITLHSAEILATDSASALYSLMRSMTAHLYQVDKLLKLACEDLRPVVRERDIVALRRRHVQRLEEELG